MMNIRNWWEHGRKVLLIFVLSTGVYQLKFIGQKQLSFHNIERSKYLSEGKKGNSRPFSVHFMKPEDFKIFAAYVQQKIHEFQNPHQCMQAKKVVCDLPPAGFGSQVHLLTICFTIGFMTQRTVIFRKGSSNYEETGWGELFQPLSINCSTVINQPVRDVLSLYKTDEIPVIKASYESFYIDLERSLPDNFSSIVLRFHKNPQLWWAGQMASYILRPTERLNFLIAEKKKSLGFKNVIVGLQIRRTDKIIEAYYYNLTEYMKFADIWFNRYEQTTGKAGIKRRIFIATDEPKVVSEAKQMFPTYTFINDINITIAASKRHERYKYSSLVGIIIDTYLLSMCDYIVCTMTSNICRLAFELMQPRYQDASKYAKSLDCEYFIQKLYKKDCRLRPKQISQLEKMLKNVSNF